MVSLGGDQFPGSMRDAVVALGVERLAITDLVEADLALIGWSGSPLHVRHVAEELERVAHGEADYLAARAPDGAPIAKCGIDLVAVSGAGTIQQLATRPDLRGLGIGTRLIAAAEARIRDRGLMVAMIAVDGDNPRTRTLYERLGYVACGERSASWESQRDDGSTFVYETLLTDLQKPLWARRSGAGHEARARGDEQEEHHREEEEHAGQQQLQSIAPHLEHDRRDAPEADEHDGEDPRDDRDALPRITRRDRAVLTPRADEQLAPEGADDRVAGDAERRQQRGG